MPPKKKGSDPSKKTVEKAKQKVVEDKTFGLKNKKGGKAQKFIVQVEKTVLHGSKTSKQIAKDQELKQARKDDKKKATDELNSLFKPVEQKVSKGVDPKSVLCAFHKAGQCKKGDKCKFSHDLNIGRKGEKRNIYDNNENADDMENWDEAKLEEVINKKHGEANQGMPSTTIICKHFLEAVENYKYGWFWQCPSGPKCHYKHALPPGFQLKRDQKKEDKTDEISLEELIEKERAALGVNNLTRVTLESFLIWKEKKRREKIANAKKAKDDRKTNFKLGKSLGVSGREMFEFNPDMVTKDDDDDDEDGGGDFDLSQFRREDPDEEDTAPVHEIDTEKFDSQMTESKGQEGITQRLQPDIATKGSRPVVNGVNSDESTKLDMAGALPDKTREVDAAIAMAQAAVANGDLDIDENLFDGDDLFEVEEELETLELKD